MVYRIGSFNMLKFSLQSDDNIRKSMSTIADIINSNFDIVAIQEILTPNALKYQLLPYLGNRWEGCWGQPRSKSPIASEGYAFVWNTSRFELAKDSDFNGQEYIVQPQIVDAYHTIPGYDRLLRDPLYGRFIPKNGPFFELRLINTHVRFSVSSNDDTPSSQTESGIVLRRNEVETLIKQICEKKATERKGNNRVAYTILLGDYNLNLKCGLNPYPYVQEYYEIFDGPVKKNYRTVQTEKTTLKQQVSDNDDESEKIDKYANNYDHFTYDETFLVDNSGISLVAHRINTLNDYCNGDVEKHRLEISDHVPIVLEMKF